MPSLIEQAPVINELITDRGPDNRLLFQTRNEGKLNEIARLMGVERDQVMGPDRSLEIDEIQGATPLDVAVAKAREARLQNDGQGLIVEDTSLHLLGFDGLPGVYANQFTQKRDMRRMWCEQAHAKGDPSAIARVMFAYDDGKDVRIWQGEVSGKLATEPRGTGGFGWDDIFIPDGQEKLADILPDWDGVERTYAELAAIDPRLKDALSPRAIALQDLISNPPRSGRWIYQLPEPYKLQLAHLRLDTLVYANEATESERIALMYPGEEPAEDTDVEGPSFQVSPDGSGEASPETDTVPDDQQSAIEGPAIEQERRLDRQALQFAYGMEFLAGNEPSPDLSTPVRQPYHELPVGDGEIRRIVPSGTSASLGLIITPWDTARDMRGKPTRLALDANDYPILWQMGPEATKMALAARLKEFKLMHSDAMHERMRAMRDGRIKIEPRPGVPSAVIEEAFQMIRRGEVSVPPQTEEDLEDGPRTEMERDMATLEAAVSLLDVQSRKTSGTSELGYARQSYEGEGYMSRTDAAENGLFVMSGGVPTSLYSLGGMPPVTGFADSMSTAALSWMRSYGPHNSIFADNPQQQLKLFEQAREQIYALRLPPDIEEMVVKQMGMSVGCINPRQIADDMKALYDAGCKSFRIYTTNPDKRIVETAEELRQRFPDAHLCVGPFVDLRQAAKLVGPDIRVDTLLAGHGGGENCTSLEAGGSANGLELLYLMYLNGLFNNTAIGLEGGTGSSIGPLLGLLDVISLNQRGVAGGAELGGLYVQHSSGAIVQPYHGSASAITQWIEAASNPEVAMRRLDEAARLNNVEGQPNYTKKHRSRNSVVDAFKQARMLAGRALADQQSRSLSDLRRNIREHGHFGHRHVTPEARVIAMNHQGRR